MNTILNISDYEKMRLMENMTLYIVSKVYGNQPVDLDYNPNEVGDALQEVMAQMLGIRRSDGSVDVPQGFGLGAVYREHLDPFIMQWPQEYKILQDIAAEHHAKKDSERLMFLLAPSAFHASRSLALIHWVTEGTKLSMVEPCLLAPDGPLIFVAKDNSGAFRIDVTAKPGEIITPCKMPSQSKVRRGVDAAWAEITTRLATIRLDPALRKQLPGMTIHVMPPAK